MTVTAIDGPLLERLLAGVTDHAIVALDLDGRVAAWNEGASLMMGWTSAEMLTRPAAAIFTEEDRLGGAADAQMRRAAETGRAVCERWHARRDGSRFWAASEMTPLRDGAGAHLGYLHLLRDRGAPHPEPARQPAEAVLLRAVLAASPDCIGVLDLDANLVFMSEGGLRVMQAGGLGTIEGRPWPDTWRGEANAEAWAAVAAAKAGGTGRFQADAATMVGNDRCWDVRVTPIHDAAGRPERLLCVARDVTRTKLAERALLEASGVNKLVLGSSHDCILVLDTDGNTRFVSPGGVRAMEVADVDAIIGLSWLRIWVGADLVAARAAVAQARASGIGRFQGFCPTHGGKARWWDVVISPLAHTAGRTEGLVVIARDITEQHQAETLLRDSEERRRLAVEAADIGTWAFDCATAEVQWDSRCKAIGGVPEAMDVTYDIFLKTLHPEDRERVAALTRGALDPSGTGAYQAEYRVVGLADGVERWVSATGKARFSDGRPVCLLGTARDVSVRKRAEQQAQLLGDELQHRVKNMLAMVQAIVGQTLRGAATPAEAQAAIELRLASLARAHGRLTSGGWEGSDLRACATDALHPYDEAPASRFDLDGPPVWLPVQAAMSLALMLNELATNAVKHGALSVPGGRVELSWTLRTADAPDTADRLDLLWRERGGPPVSAPARRGFGSRLIERGLASALGGQASLAFEADGLTCRVAGSLARPR